MSRTPVAILNVPMFMWELWGGAAAVLAAPRLATCKIRCYRTETLAPEGEFLGD